MALISKPNVFVNGAVADAAAVNADFDTVYNDYNGNITDANIANTGITTYGKVQASSIGSLAGLNAGAGLVPLANLPVVATLANIYPVGCIYTTTVSTNPATVFGIGTWVAFGAGRVMIGAGTSDQTFTAGAIGGESTHVLTTPEMPAHTHGIGSGGNAAAGSSTAGVSGSAGVTSTSTGGGGAHNNLQSYIVVYFWQRTA